MFHFPIPTLDHGDRGLCSWWIGTIVVIYRLSCLCCSKEEEDKRKATEPKVNLFIYLPLTCHEGKKLGTQKTLAHIKRYIVFNYNRITTLTEAWR